MTARGRTARMLAAIDRALQRSERPLDPPWEVGDQGLTRCRCGERLSFAWPPSCPKCGALKVTCIADECYAEALEPGWCAAHHPVTGWRMPCSRADEREAVTRLTREAFVQLGLLEERSFRATGRPADLTVGEYILVRQAAERAEGDLLRQLQSYQTDCAWASPSEDS